MLCAFDVTATVLNFNSIYAVYVVNISEILPSQFLSLQVETVGQVYMAVGGAPEYTPQHAENVADVALCLLRHVKQLKLPSGISIQIRIGQSLAVSLHKSEPPPYKSL
jgi:guanylate cyclase